jgi:hypothetical protein
MTDPESEDHQPERRSPVLPGRRTRVAAAIVGCLVSLGVPLAALSTPTLTVDQQPVRPSDDPAGLGITGARPGDPLPSGEAAATAVGDDGLGAGALPSALPGIPIQPGLPDGPLGIPGVALDAYQFAQRTLAAIRPECHLSWAVLAGIGRIESDHASDGRVDAFENTLGPILGPRLDGSPGVAAVPDTDQGALDSDTVWDRAVGPMQFIPSTWRSFSVDGNGDGVANPNNIYDSTVTAGLYLCASGVNLSDPLQLQAAVFRYNNSASYVDVVLRWAHAYLTGVVPVPSAPGPVPPGINGNGGRLTPIDTASPAPVAVAHATPTTPAPATVSPSPTLPSPTPPAATPMPAPTTAPEATSTSPSPTPTVTPATLPPTTVSPTPTATPTTVLPRALPATTPAPVSPTPSLTPIPTPTPPPPATTTTSIPPPVAP